jgi:hypothetical protein
VRRIAVAVAVFIPIAGRLSSPPVYNPYPPATLPSNISSELARVKGEITGTFNSCVRRRQARSMTNPFKVSRFGATSWSARFPGELQEAPVRWIARTDRPTSLLTKGSICATLPCPHSFCPPDSALAKSGKPWHVRVIHQSPSERN